MPDVLDFFFFFFGGGGGGAGKQYMLGPSICIKKNEDSDQQFNSIHRVCSQNSKIAIFQVYKCSCSYTELKRF